jgi:hypothetical protein
MANQFPRWVRVLAVLHGLSLMLGPLGFFLLMGMAGYVGYQRSGMDSTSLILGLCALACPALGAGYRAWFEWYGRRRWPTGQYESPSGSSGLSP